MNEVDTIIIGAGSAGLACAAALKHQGVENLILERSSNVASRWRGHYDRLHLHTDKKASSLPFYPMPGSFPKYPSRDLVVKYLEDYADWTGAKIEFDTDVTSVHKENGKWHIDTASGTNYTSRHLVICTGKTNKPNWVRKPGLETFKGKVMHSAEYKNGAEFEGQRVLVIGFGNSGCEIAICLHEHGAKPSMSVRNPVNVVPRDIFGIPALSIGKLTSGLPPRISDKINKPIIDFLYGDITKYGLRKLPYGPVEQINKHGRIPLLDIGTIDLVRKGDIKVYQDIARIEDNRIDFVEGESAEFDAIIMATGYSHSLSSIIDLSDEREDELCKPIQERKTAGSNGLYLCGLYVSPRGMLNEAGKEALFVAKSISTGGVS